MLLNGKFSQPYSQYPVRVQAYVQSLVIKSAFSIMASSHAPPIRKDKCIRPKSHKPECTLCRTLKEDFPSFATNLFNPFLEVSS